MLAYKLNFIERHFRETGGNRLFRFNYFNIKNGISAGVPLSVCKIHPTSRYMRYFFKRKTNKKRIVLHSSLGNLNSDAHALTRRRGVSVPFLIARDGTIYNLFSSKYWAFHLGDAAFGGNAGSSKSSVGVMLSNYGPLKKVGDNLETYYSRLPAGSAKRKPPQVYCTLNDTDFYTKLPTPYKQCHYFATYTHAQYYSLIVLLRYLTQAHNIPRNFLDEPLRFRSSSLTAGFEGIITHSNCIAGGVAEIAPAPAFNWDWVVGNV